MLLRNESKILYSLLVHLVFDDYTYKETEIKIGDIVDLSFRRNQCKLSSKGKITNIKPIVKSEKAFECIPTEYNINNALPEIDAIIYIDSSTEYESFKVQIKLSDILDINTVNDEEVKVVDPNAPVVEPDEPTKGDDKSTEENHTDNPGSESENKTEDTQEPTNPTT